MALYPVLGILGLVSVSMCNKVYGLLWPWGLEQSNACNMCVVVFVVVVYLLVLGCVVALCRVALLRSSLVIRSRTPYVPWPCTCTCRCSLSVAFAAILQSLQLYLDVCWACVDVLLCKLNSLI